MPNLRLTELTVRALKGSTKYQTYWDTVTLGFGVRVGLRSKTWTVMRGRSRERVTMGRHPDISLADARTEAKRLLSTTPEAAASSMTFAAARGQFLAEHYRDKGDRTKYQVTRSLTRHFKALETMQLAAIGDSKFEKALGKLSDRPSEQLHAYR